MTRGTVVLLGNFSLDPALDSLTAAFGWSLEQAAGFDQLRDLSADRHVVAVLVDANGLGLSWREVLKSVLDIDSKALPVVCHRFSENIHWPEIADAGAFHALSLPLDPLELRQSLGFVWAAKRHPPAEVIPLRHMERAIMLTSLEDVHNSACKAVSAA